MSACFNNSGRLIYFIEPHMTDQTMAVQINDLIPGYAPRRRIKLVKVAKWEECGCTWSGTNLRIS